MTDVKLCRDCRHFRISLGDLILGWGYEFARCAVVQVPVMNGSALVPFRPGYRDMAFCFSERNPRYESINPCGSTGKLWEAK